MNARTRPSALFVLLALLCAGGAVDGYPIAPQGLRQLFEESELVVVANVSSVRKAEPVARNDDDWTSTKATLAVTSVLKGKASGLTVTVYYSADVICPIPPGYSEGETVLAFLTSLPDGGGYFTSGLSYGAKCLSPDALDVYLARIEELKGILKLTDAEEQTRQTAAWLMKCIENRETRGEGFLDLCPPCPPVTRAAAQNRRQFWQYLSRGQKGVLLSMLASAGADETPIGPSGMWQWAPAIMSILAETAGDQQLSAILARFDAIECRSKADFHEQRKLLSQFVEAYKRLPSGTNPETEK